MTVGAPDLTLCYFCRDGIPTTSRADQVRDVVALNPRNMVKLQNYRIAFATIDARMFAKILEQEAHVTCYRTQICFPVPGLLVRGASQIRSSVRQLSTLLALVLQTIVGRAVPLELGLVFLFFTSRAAFHAGILQVLLVIIHQRTRRSLELLGVVGREGFEPP